MPGSVDALVVDVGGPQVLRQAMISEVPALETRSLASGLYYLLLTGVGGEQRLRFVWE